jgi:hypothetical protein
LIYTAFDSFPTAEFQLPVRSFYLRVPECLEMWCNVPSLMYGDLFTAEEAPQLGLIQQRETEQPLDGFLVTGEYQGSRLTALRVLAAGRGSTPEEDNTHWFHLGLQGATLGAVVAAAAQEARDHQAEEWLEEREMRLVLGTILYLQMAHPELTPIPPTPRPGVKRKGSGKRIWKQYEASTRYTVVVIGSPRDEIERVQIKRTPGRLTRRPPRPHMRAGHWRAVWLGAHTDPTRHTETRWIKPVWVGDWARIEQYESIEQIRRVERRPRPADVHTILPVDEPAAGGRA